MVFNRNSLLGKEDVKRRKTSKLVIGIVDEKLENFCNKSSEETFLKHI